MTSSVSKALHADIATPLSRQIERGETFLSHTYPKTGNVSSEDICTICRKNLKQNEMIWEHRTTVHKKSGISQSSLCLMHGACLKKRLNINPKCPSCKSPFEFHYYEILTLKERAKIILLDGLDGAMTGTKIGLAAASFFFTAIVGPALSSGRITYEQIPSMLNEGGVSGPLKALIFTPITIGTLAFMAFLHIKRQGWFFRQIRWPHGYDRSLFRVIYG